MQEKKVVRRVAPPSLLFEYSVLSPVDDVDKVWPGDCPFWNKVEFRTTDHPVCLYV
jgi:hypothetical protein